MKNSDNKLIEKVISSLDWDSIFEVNNCFKRGIGDGTSVIPGVKRKSWGEGITKNDLKNELKCLIRYVIQNDISELAHGYWLIIWSNAEWSEDHISELKKRLQEEEENGQKINMIWEELELESTLEVIYSPQRICVVDNSKRVQSETPEPTDLERIQGMLQKALDNEQYELASKLKDVVRLQKGTEE